MFYHAVEEIEHKGLSYNLYVDLYGEDPNATEEDVALCRAWQTHYVDMICTTIRRLFLLDIQNPDVPLDALPPVRRILCGKEGLFEGGLIDQRLLTLHEHPWDYDNAHWITLWDDVLEPKLRARL